MSRSIFRLPAFVIALGLPLVAGADCMGPYPPSMVRAFNQNCAKDSQMLPFCSCIMDEVQKNIPLVDFIEIGNSSSGINGDPRFIKASKDCSSKLPGAPAATAQPAPAQPAATAQPGTRMPQNTGIIGSPTR